MSEDEAEADARRWGLELAPACPAEDGVWPENVAAIEAFLAVSTQWRFAGGGMGRLLALGLDYAGARAGLALAGIPVTRALWSDVMLIELGARSAMNEEPR